MFLSSDIILEYRIQLVDMGQPCIVFTFPTKYFTGMFQDL